MPDITLDLEVSLREDQIVKLTKHKEGPRAKILNGMATWLLRAAADDGLMLTPETVARIFDLAGEDATQELVLKTFEFAVGRDGDNLVVKWRIDSSYEPALKEMAAMQGRTPQELVQENMDRFCDLGWVFNEPVENFTVRFTVEQKRELQALTGKENPTGVDVIALLEESRTAPQEA